MNIGRSQANAIASGALARIGTAKTDGSELSIVNEMLVKAAEVFITNVQENIDKNNSVSTGELSSAITFSLKNDRSGYVLSVGYPVSSEAAGYYDYVNKGVAGLQDRSGAIGPYKFRFPWVTKSHATAILKWVRTNKGKSFTRTAQVYTMGGVETKSNRIRKMATGADSLKSMAYAIAAKTKREGIKPTRFFDEAIATTFNKDFMDAMSLALGAEVRLAIKEYFPKENGSTS